MRRKRSRKRSRRRSVRRKRSLTKGRVPPPSTMVVKSTTIRVVVTSTFLT